MIRTLAGVLAAALVSIVLPAFAQGWPRGIAVNVVVPLAAGDGGDTTARAMSDVLARELETSIVVNNRPGAGGAVGVQYVIQSRKDGYTVLFTQNSPLTIRRVLEPTTANYDPLQELVPVAITTRSPSVLVVRNDSPFRSFQQMVAYARRHPGEVRIGNAGPASAGDLSVQLINSEAGVELASIPYKGAAPSLTDVIGGRVEGVILALGAVASHMKAGTLKAIAISSPFPDLPEVPTLTKLGYKQDLLGVWFAWMLPAGTPPDVVHTMAEALYKATRDADVSQKLLPLGLLQDWEPSAQLTNEITHEYETASQLTSRLKK